MKAPTESSVVFVALLLLVACAAPQHAPPSAPTEAWIPPPSKTPLAVSTDAPSIDALTAARRAYVERGDPRALFGMWDDAMRVRAGRSRRPSERDMVFDKARLQTIYEWATSHQERSTLRFVSPHLEMAGSVATIEWLAVETVPGSAPSAFGEQYRLEKRGGEWKVVRFDYWPLSPDTFEELGAHFATADREVDAARARGDERHLAFHLMSAFRFDECAQTTRRLTDHAPTDTWAWDMRAKASALIGDRADAEMSSAEWKRLTGTP